MNKQRDQGSEGPGPLHGQLGVSGTAQLPGTSPCLLSNSIPPGLVLEGA